MAIRVTESGATRLSESGDTRITESHVEGTEWPADLPQSFLLGTYQSARPSVVIRSQPEAGPAIIRRRFSAGVTPFAGEMVLSQAQRDALMEFFDETVLSGAVDFTFPAQDGSGGTWDVRFTGEPSETKITGTHWRVSLAMERLP